MQAGEGGAECGGGDLLTHAPKLWSLLRAPVGPQNAVVLCMVTAWDSAPGGWVVRPILGDPSSGLMAASFPPEFLPEWMDW